MTDTTPPTAPLPTQLLTALYHICDKHTQYEPLRSSFGMIVSESSERLSQVNRSFPDYTRHDIKHSENIVAKMEMLIGPERIALLSPTDIWLLLMCAYTHDWGMTVSLADLREHLEKEDGLRSHMEAMREEHQGLYSTAAHNLDLERLAEQLQTSPDDADPILRALNTQRSLMLVLQSYFRRHHSDGYGRELDKCDFTGIPRRLRTLVADINATHVSDFKQVMKLPYKTDGYGTDSAHPRCIAEMLRLSDLMDIDSGRVNPFQVRLGANNMESMAHQEKHLAVTMVLTSPEKVGAHFSFDTASIMKNYEDYGDEPCKELARRKSEAKATELRTQAAKEAFAWYDMLKEELKDFSLNWHSIVPKGYTGSAPTIEDGEFHVNFDGVSVNAKDLDLRYILSYVRAFEIIRGAGLYRDRLTFIRELVQNAMDATKLQLFLDWEARNGIQKSEISIRKFFSLLHGNINEFAVRVEIEIFPAPDEHVVLRISDFGTGICHEKLRKLRFVGNIHDTETDKIKKRMPEWLKPTGSFGIGLQSVFDFLTSRNRDVNTFTLTTRSAKTNETLKIDFRANRSEGEIFYKECHRNNCRKRNGTDVEVPLTEHLDKILIYFGVNGADLSTDKAIKVAEHIREYLKRTISHDIVPLLFEIKKHDHHDVDSKTQSTILRDKPFASYDKKPEIIKQNVFKNAFKKDLFYDTRDMYDQESDKPDAEWLYVDYDYYINLDDLTFWQWNPINHILVKVSLNNRLKVISQSERLLARNLSGKADFSFRGIRVEVGNRERLAKYEWDKTDAPWCDMEVYVMGGDAKHLLAINRDELLKPVSPRDSKVLYMLNCVKSTMRIGFEHTLRCIAANWDKWEHTLTASKYTSEACILLSLAAHCLYKASIDTPTTPIHEQDAPTIVINKATAGYCKTAFEKLVSMLERQEYKHFVEVMDYDRTSKQVLEYRYIPIWQLLRQLDTIWFTNAFPADINEGSLTPETAIVADIVTICEDLFSVIPVSLYWSDVFFIKTKNNLLPIYQLCAVASKSFCNDNDAKELFQASFSYGTLEAKRQEHKEAKLLRKQGGGRRKQDSPPKLSDDEKKIRKNLARLLGERHVFPALAGYEVLCVPYNKERCPEVLDRSGYVIISPFIPKLFETGRNIFAELIEAVNEINEASRKIKVFDEAKIRKIMAQKRKAVWSVLYPDAEKEEDIYGIYALIEYVREQNGNKKPIGEYKQAYADLILKYTCLYRRQWKPF